MIFDVVRTSDWGFNENHKPCKNARIHTFEKEIKTYIFDPDDGHKIEQTKGLKEFKTWVVDINTLEELLAFRDEVGEEIIIGETDAFRHTDGFIEIYDDVREQEVLE